jgi:hypothetical protein
VVKDFDGNSMMDGIDVIREQYGQLFRDSPDLHVEIPRRMVQGDYVIDQEVITGFVLPGYPTEMRAVVVYRVRDGVIADMMLLS